MSFLISFEGIEGCGKTTQLKLAAQFLRKSNVPVLTTEEPGGTPLGKKIRKLLLNRWSFEICAEAEILLFLAARAQHIREVLRPALDRGEWILCDRFSDATMVYQGIVRGIETTWIRQLDDFATSSLKPDLTFLFDLPAEKGLHRAMQRMTGIPENAREDRFEQEGLKFHQKIREGYLSLARQEPDRFRVLNADADIASISREVCRHLSIFRSQHS
ncbi:thymidylate kinase [Syntrophus gentianae]|uniref:Thymidylate kinase n=1 Tax=Syntrophus gentianae TaxID=43775 RepID=A0A1H7WWR9_9BACT|nr:dTMP kinase [Syntrophus gentianae]SEM26050.1 thymidylate kinase [Syntrophus gentianae]